MNKKYDRDFFDWHASPRPGRLGPRLLQYTPDAGDGIPGLQWMFRKMLEILGQYFVIEGCEYSESDSGKITAGWIFFESKIVKVSEQTSVGVLSSLGNGYFIYINENGVAGNSNVDGTFISNVISSMREHSTTIDVRFKGHANKFVISHDLIVGKNVTFHKDLTVHNNIDVDGISNLDNVDIDGTLDVAGITDFHSDVDMNSNKITNLAAPTVANDGVRKNYVDTFVLGEDLGGTLSAPTVVNDSHTHNTQYYTKTLLNGGQLNNLYYTETELNNGQLDNRYFRENEFLNISAGIGDAGKPIKLDAAGHIDASMVNDGDISHLNITNIGSNSHTAIDTHISSTILPHISSTSKSHWDSAYSHISASGSSHTYLNQGVTTGSSPSFNQVTVSNGIITNKIIHGGDTLTIETEPATKLFFYVGYELGIIGQRYVDPLPENEPFYLVASKYLASDDGTVQSYDEVDDLQLMRELKVFNKPKFLDKGKTKPITVFNADSLPWRKALQYPIYDSDNNKNNTYSTSREKIGFLLSAIKKIIERQDLLIKEIELLKE